ncbi:MAG: AAA family ATPase [Bacteroidales bacterium]|nr:AAA family ATPase [Bacteroidales bacterium]
MDKDTININPTGELRRKKNELTKYQANFIQKLNFNINPEIIERIEDEDRRKALSKYLNRSNDLPDVHRTNERRVFSPLTAMPRELRKHITYNGSTLIEVDAANSQPLLLVNELLKNEYPVEPELIEILQKGGFYEMFAETKLSRDEIKEFAFKFLFSKSINSNGIIYKKLKEKFPLFIDSFIKYMADQKSMAATLQKIESNIWIDKISTNCMNSGIDHATIHDSIVFPGNENIYKVLDIVDKAFEQNMKPELHINTLKGKPIDLQTASVLLGHNFNTWLRIASETPTPKQLFGNFFVEGETVFLFADSNVGKSLLAVQIGQSIASSVPIHEDIPVETSPQLVLYFDFEMSCKQLEKRYTGFEFSENFQRFELKRDALITDSLEDAIFKQIEHEVNTTGAKVIIIDNITYIKSKAEKTDEAAKFMRLLNQLRAKLNLSILVLTHTPKRDMKNPITENDMIGSKNLTNAADSSFTIGRSSKGVDMRYIKQTKVRLGDHLYHAGNVIDCEIGVKDNFTGFQLNGFSPEFSHLKRVTETDKRDQEFYEMKQTGSTYQEIADQFGCHVQTAKNGVNRYKNDNIEDNIPF